MHVSMKSVSLWVSSVSRGAEGGAGRGQGSFFLVLKERQICQLEVDILNNIRALNRVKLIHACDLTKFFI